jgi:hypothetical protein
MSWETIFIVGSLIFAVVVIIGGNVWAIRGPSIGPDHREQLVPTSDQILLCSFGLNLDGERTEDELCAQLRTAGFTAPAIRHLIRTSRLLRRDSAGCYHLRAFRP